MQLWKKQLIYVLLVLMAITALYYVGGINARKSNKRLTDVVKLMEYSDSVQVVEYEAEIKGYKRDISESRQIVLTQKEAIKTGLIEKDRYKNLYLKQIDHVVNLQTEIKVLSDSIAKVSAEVIYVPVDDGPDVPVLVLPFTFKQKNDYLNLSGGFKIDGSMYFSLYMPLELDITLGVKKRSQISVVSAFSDSPHIGTINIRSTKIIKQSRWIDSGWVKFGAGVIAGGLIVNQLSK